MKNLLEGTISLTRKARGYVRADGSEDEIEIDAASLNTALHGDRVSVELLPKRPGVGRTSRVQGEVVKVLLRAKVNFSGKIEMREGVAFFVPDDVKAYIDFIIPKEKLSGAASGAKIIAKISRWSDPKKNPEGEIVKILGTAGEHNAEMLALALEKGFDQSFPENVEKEAGAFSDKITEEEIQKRRDFRNIRTFTIDPANAKDFDDALSLRTLPDGIFEVGVHIADVSHYVRPGAALDKEAGIRGTSVYLVDRTIPMLPEKLSNDLCSLKPDVDRLAFSAIFQFTPESSQKDKKTVITNVWFGKTVIRSQMRFAYEDAEKILNAGRGEFFGELSTLRAIAQNLERERKAKGAINFEGDELAIEINRDGMPLAIRKKVRLETNRLVEDFMLLANRRVAEFISKIGRKEEKLFVYRIHDEPNAERLRELSTFVRNFGYKLKIPEDGNISSKDLAEFLAHMEETPIKNIVHSTALRSMAKAVYSTKNIGHYGLAFKHYTHFTSPIRRYPDILAHRLLFSYLNHEKIPHKLWEEYESVLVYSSEQERKATEAERDSVKYKQVEFMLPKLGKVFDGIITGVTEWGIFVAEKETLAEGMVSLRDLKDDYYVLDEKHYRLVGEKTKKRYSLGDEVKIELVRANLAEKTLDYIFYEEEIKIKKQNGGKKER